MLKEEKKNVQTGEEIAETTPTVDELPVTDTPVENADATETADLGEAQDTVSGEQGSTESTEIPVETEIPKSQEPVIETFDIEKVNKKKEKKSPVGLIVILVLLCIAGVASFYAYKYFNVHPTGIVKSVINRSYENFSKSLKEIDGNTGDIDIFNEAVRVIGDFQFDDGVTKGLDKEKIKFDVALDYSNKRAEGMLGLLKNGSTMADAKYYFQNDKMYMGSTTMFDNVYDLGEYKFDDMFDLSDFENLDMNNVPTVDDVDYIVKEFKDILLDSLDEKDMTLSKEDLEIKGKTVKTDKITYKINNSSMEKLKSSMADNVLKNDALISRLAKVTNGDEKEIRESFEEFKSSEVSDDLISGEFILYTTGIDHSLVKAELSDSYEKIYITVEDNVTTIAYDGKDVKYEIVMTDNKNTCDVDIKIGGITLVNMTFRENKAGIDFDYKIDYAGITLDGTIKYTYEPKGKKEGSGEVFFSLNGDVMDEKLAYEIKLDYEIKADDDLEKIDTTKVLKDFTESDIEKMDEKMDELQESALYGYFGGAMLENSPMSTY